MKKEYKLWALLTPKGSLIHERGTSEETIFISRKKCDVEQERLHDEKLVKVKVIVGV